MGDGGVACAPSRSVRLPVASEAYCVGGVLASKVFKMRQEEDGEFLPGADKGRKSDERARLEKGDFAPEQRRRGEGESQNGELEKGEFVPDRWRKGEVEAGEFVPERPHRGELEKGEFATEKRRKGGESDRLDFNSGRSRRVELEKGEFVPERRQKDGPEHDRTPEDSYRRRDGDQSERDRRKRSSSKSGKRETSVHERDSDKRETSVHERDSRKYPRAAEEELGQQKFELSNGKSRDKNYNVESKQKRHCPEMDSSSRKYYAEHTDHSGLKSRREMEDWKRPANRERSHRDASSSSSRVSSVSKYSSSRHIESSLPSRGSHDRHGRSPERARHHDLRDRIPNHLERSPHDPTRNYDHRNHTSGNSDRSQHERARHQDQRVGTPKRPDRSPHERARYLDHRDRTPSQSDRSPHERVRYQDHWDRTPTHSDRSPHERVRYQDHRDRTPSHSDRSPHERIHYQERRDRTPSQSDRSPHERIQYKERRDRTPGRSEHSPHDRGRNNTTWNQYTKSGGSEKQQNSRHEERPARESSGKDPQKNQRQLNCSSINSSRDRGVGDKSKKKKVPESSTKEPIEPPLPPPPPPPLPPPVLPPPPPLPPHPDANGFLEELPSMEEDMDICNTPPHDTIMTDLGKWSYIDHFGIERGPSRLADLKRLVEEGFLHSDHLIKHSDIDRWVTVENAASPLLPTDLPSIVSDAVTEMVSPPEAPGNLLVDAGDLSRETSSPMLQQEDGLIPIAPELVEDLLIDERVEALLNGHTIIDGKELETIGEALDVTFEHVEWEKWSHSEDFTRFQVHSYEPPGHPRDEGSGRTFEGLAIEESVEARPGAPFEEYPIHSDWFAGRWSCKGGDWKRNDEAGQDRYYKRKLVLNEGYPLCQMPKCGLEDPRLYRRDDLYHPSRVRKLDLPPWAFSSVEDTNDNEVNKNILAARTCQLKQPMPRGVKGTMLPVVRINACVVKDHGSVEPRMKMKGKERHTPRSSRSHSTSGDMNSFSEGSYHSKKIHERDLHSLHKCRTVLNIPKDHVCTVDELSLDLGDWYYLDGAGHEHGPSSYSELQELVSKDTIPEHSSVFRKIDNVWLPITSAVASEAVLTQDAVLPPANPSVTTTTQLQIGHDDANNTSHSFHSMYPQFVGYMRGKLHELVMKSFKNREFAAVINEVLDPWLSARQPKKDMDKHFPFNSSITKSADSNTFGTYEDNPRSGKRARMLVDGSGESEAEEDLLTGLKHDCSFEDLCGETTFVEDDGVGSQAETENWGFLNGRILSRIFHFLSADMKSLVFSANTCKHWNIAVKFYKNLCKHVDLSSAGLNCTNSMFQSIMGGYEKKNVTSIGLAGCSNVSACVLEEILPLFPCLSYIDIRGCSQLKDLECKFQDIKWIKSSYNTKYPGDSNSKIRSLKQISDKSFSASKSLSSLGNYLNDIGETGDFCSRETKLVDKKDSSGHTFRQGFYKRTKLLDARKSSAIPLRDAHMRRWMHKKSENGYRKMQEFIALSLKDIMKGNIFDFFIPKVAKIEDRMRSGYYIRYGLGSIKDDISRMCRDALKAKNRDNAGDLKQIILSFIQLAESLKENRKISRERDEMIKTLKDSSDAGFYSSANKYSKKHSKVTSEKKGINRTQSTSYANGGTDYGAYAFDREIKRSLSKLKSKNRGSESETSDDLSEEDVRDEADSTASDTESDVDLHLGGGTGDINGDRYSMVDDISDSMTDDREWGARMTKASLVPPVTRKYEVIDKYLVVADEEEVQQKMRVGLPDDFSEKVLAQRSGMEESDMELPEVKEYKPRKLLGVEVLEQEVYGIDPYTHNLLLDSMPDEPEWPLVEKHKFIEEVLLCILNKQVRHFTGAGNTPMVYPLRLVVVEIQKNAEEDGDTRTVKMCHAILKAMQTRPDDNYVAYRKGLGVVCNKEEGFGEDDFVVEFLGEVYPSWKWFEKQDGIRSLQKNSEDPAPEFYNIYLERPKGDRDGYDLVVVDAMHKANYASRICHSCRPNCEAKVTAVDGQYQIGIYTVRPIGYGEEITFDYNSVTESKKEYEASVCLCGSQVCRGSYLNLTGEGAFEKVLRDRHGILDRHKLILEACESNSVSQEDYIELGRAGLGTCLLAGLPDWLVAYSAHLVRFINFERTQLPDEILKHNLEEKRKFFSDISLEVEKNEAEVQAEGVYNARLQNMALTLDKVRYLTRRVFGDPKIAPPPIQKLNPETLVSVIWEGEGSLVEELLQSMAPHVEADLLNNLKSNIHAHNPSRSDDLRRELRKSLLWLRDELRTFPCTYKCRHDAAADLIHMYAYTRCFFKVREYKAVKSPPVYISPLDLGPKYVDKMGSGFQEYCKAYGENYCLGQLIYWYTQDNADPDCSLAKARKGCVALPDVSSFYAKSNKPLREHVYGSRTLRFMLSRMETQPQRPWPKDRIWLYKSRPKFFGSPMLDAVLNKCPLDKEMMHWLRSRPSVFQGARDG